ncbi:MAG: SDR family oxidoreductase [Nitrospirota bacterium]|nr:MAG: SDR family oxidoreductase [Nitrospirota bacterium]
MSQDREQNFIITGATGLIGSHVLYELVRLKAMGSITGNLAVLTRPKSHSGVSSEERIRSLLAHPDAPDYMRDPEVAACAGSVITISADIMSPNLKDQLSVVNDGSWYVIHCAGSTNLFSDHKAEIEVRDTNYNGTLALLKALGGRTSKFIYISTAFSCGIREGIIDDNYLDMKPGEFRNPYERYKFLTEKAVAEWCNQSGIPWQILRPSATCGRLLDPPLYVTTKFDVFYGWAGFFNKYHAEGHDFGHVRLWINEKGGLNIVPADYVAKAIIEATKSSFTEVNICHSQPLMYTKYMPIMNKKIGLTSYEFVSDMPSGKLTKFERLFYNTVHRAMGPYVCGDLAVYDTKRLRDILKSENEPNIELGFGGLIDFAVSREFKSQWV